MNDRPVTTEIANELAVAAQRTSANLRTTAGLGLYLLNRKKQDQHAALQNAAQQQKTAQKSQLRGAPTRFQQNQWQTEIGAGDKIALQVHGETVHSGEILTNPTNDGYVKLRFDNPPSPDFPDIWNIEELKVELTPFSGVWFMPF